MVLRFQVVETTHCTVNQAEIALYDNNNDVQEAVNAILEDNYPDENVWQEQKSRRAKRAEAAEEMNKNEESNSSHRNRTTNSTRGTNNYGYGRGRGTERGRGGYRGGRGGGGRGYGRGRGTERGRGGYRGGRGGGGRGSYRGGYQQTSSSSQQQQQQQGLFSCNVGSNVWDNSQALKIDMAKDWTNAAATMIDDSAEDTEWVRSYTLRCPGSCKHPGTKIWHF
ncbi:unnamed protein product [Gongylonema pulchrum]|uniref:CUE domain-containing protein n=1 Tax=Gongylonema pulchrum TaxID=637853 RepID=A0A183EA80_9BILA|nr:unnamed protein product [Gongylonema pulchrum]